MKRLTIYALAALALAGCASDPTSHGIPNLACVDAATARYRGGEPTPVGWAWLRAHGVTNEIKLDEGSSTAPVGWTVFRHPMSTAEQIMGPVGPQIVAAELDMETHPGCFTHCAHGMNRTGTVLIWYRMHHDHWTKARAIAEADKFDWGSSFPALKKWVAAL